jgi:nucleoside-diphosphate-sugar epimerase
MLAASAVSRRLALGGGTHVATCMIFQLYGPGDDVRPVILTAACVLLAGRGFATSTGHPVRNFLHVEDVAAASLTLLEQRAEGVFNIASGEPTTLRRLVGRVGELVGRPELIDFSAVAMRAGEPECIYGSHAKLRSLGWHVRSPSCRMT